MGSNIASIVTKLDEPVQLALVTTGEAEGSGKAAAVIESSVGYVR